MDDDPLPAIAKCTRCGRGFVSIGIKSDFIDHYGPQKYSAVKPLANGECGGRIELRSSSLPQPSNG